MKGSKCNSVRAISNRKRCKNVQGVPPFHFHQLCNLENKFPPSTHSLSLFPSVSPKCYHYTCVLANVSLIFQSWLPTEIYFYTHQQLCKIIILTYIYFSFSFKTICIVFQITASSSTNLVHQGISFLIICSSKMIRQLFFFLFWFIFETGV